MNLENIYIYKNKETRDENPQNFFLISTRSVKPSRFNKYFDSQVNIEKQCYLYLQKEVNDLHSIDYTQATPVFETVEQQEAYDAYMAQFVEEQQGSETGSQTGSES